MISSEIREKFITFFTHPARGHKEISAAPLTPENDPTTLFTSSGMQQLVPYLMGESHPQGRRLVDSQLCVRVVDIEEVGDNRHLTLLEMLGNWSLGDYFKEEQLAWFYEFLTKELKLPPGKLYCSVFEGTQGLPKDEESAEIWQKLGVPSNRIYYYGVDKNWWSRSGPPEQMPPGEIGGPDSEVFFDFETPHKPEFGEKCHPNCDCGRFLEIGNSVFIQYVKKEDESLEELPQKNVDFGGGLERLTAALLNKPDVFVTDFFLDAKEKLEELKTNPTKRDLSHTRIILDHLRAASFIISENVKPSNKEHGYVLRRLIRRAALHAYLIGIELDQKGNLASLVRKFAQTAPPSHSRIAQKIDSIAQIMAKEIEGFQKALEIGAKKITSLTPGTLISGEEAFNFYQTYGYPLELLKEVALLHHLKIDESGFQKAKTSHQQKSRASAQKKFSGGLADFSEQTTKLHTATHLLHQALRDVLGSQVQQKGSNITAERLRFDFNFDRPLTNHELGQIEKIVNQKITANLPVTARKMSLAQAQKEGALAFFVDHYNEKVKVYSIGDYSKEVCGGPQVKTTGGLGHFKITKQESIGSGIRRIKAVLE